MSIIVVGGGLSGIVSALEIARHRHVFIVNKAPHFQSSSFWAQGGIASSFSNENDSVGAHLHDTFIASDQTTDRNCAFPLLSDAPEALMWLIKKNVPFSRDNQSFHLVREGGHSCRRIFHAADQTGSAILQCLTEWAHNNPRIHWKNDQLAVDIHTENNTCTGLRVLDKRKNQFIDYEAEHIILACGGLGQLYQHTTNPPNSTGDGIAMGWRCGCILSNMEFIQFHPTGFYHCGTTPFLVTEAIRGEGARLCGRNGHFFMADFDKRGDLAPRDILSRAIVSYLQSTQEDHVYLDATSLDKKLLTKNFPLLYHNCLKYEIDIAESPIPVIPTAHYCCGGIQTTLTGETNVANLWAIGETADTGLHGGNRLASNSLLECVVMGRRCAAAVLTRKTKNVRYLGITNTSITPKEENDRPHYENTIKKTMTEYAGIIRSQKGLEKAQKIINDIDNKISSFPITSIAGQEQINLLHCAQLVLDASQKRKNNRASYFNQDILHKKEFVFSKTIHSR